MVVISATLASLDLRQRLTWSLVWWTSVRTGVSRLIPALLSIFYRIPALLHKENNNKECPKDRDPLTAEENGGKIYCEILYEPPEDLWNLDIIFIHGLHGSTVKTWRQGDWSSKYPAVQKTAFRRHSSMTSATLSKEKHCRTCSSSAKKTFRSISTPNNFKTLASSDASDDEDSQIDTDVESGESEEDILYFETSYNANSEMFDSIPSQLVNREYGNNSQCDKSDNLLDICDIDYTEHDDKCNINVMKRKHNKRSHYEVKKFRKTDNKSLDDYLNSGEDNAEQEIWSLLEESEFCDCTSTTDEEDSENDESFKNIFYPENVLESLSSCWPRDWIPQDHPGARVISISYTTDPYLWRPLWMKQCYRTSLEERTREMVKELAGIHAGTKPILWVGHSKGGLFIKEIFSKGFEDFTHGDSTSDNGNIYEKTKAMVFYSVPHRGSHLANISIPALLRPSSELREIQYESEFVLKLHEKFLKALSESKSPPSIQSYMETRRTLMGAFYLRIVSLLSGDPGVGSMYGVSLDHREICKPTSRSCFLYKELLDVIQQIFHNN